MKVDLIHFSMYPYLNKTPPILNNPQIISLGTNTDTSLSYVIKLTQKPTKILLKQSLQLGDPCCSLLAVFKLDLFQSGIEAKGPNINTLSGNITGMSFWY